MTDIDRRALMMGAGASVLTAGLAGGAAAATMSNIVLTREGAVEGQLRQASVAFLGIPYAAAPVGPLRFRPAAPPTRRGGPLAATAFGPSAIQDQPAAGTRPLRTSEDCLTLNIWTPQARGRYPVYVWVHGGGNVSGTSGMPMFDGERYARHGIVCVTVNYRLGALGFLDVSALLGADYAGSGNNGLLDIVQALRWIRDNIAAFGGDPGQVTLGGQSAGAKNVCSLLAMPDADGLFHRAIVESGGGYAVATPAQARRTAVQLVEACRLSDPRQLQSIAPAALIEGQRQVPPLAWRKSPFRPVVDGVRLFAPPLRVIAGKRRRIPLLLGTNRDEAVFFGPAKGDDGRVTQGDLTNMAVAAFAPVHAAYSGLLPERTVADRRYLALTAAEYWRPTLDLAETVARPGGRAWLYRLDLPGTLAGFADYVPHTAELALTWDNFRVAGVTATPAATALATVMHRHWVAFIRTGRPDPAAAVAWPTFDSTARATMVFDASSRVVRDPEREQRLLWDAARFDAASTPAD